MPVSKEELERLLQEHTEQRKELLEMEATNTLSHAEKIKRKLEAKLNRKSPQAHDDSNDVNADDTHKVNVNIMELTLSAEFLKIY